MDLDDELFAQRTPAEVDEISVRRLVGNLNEARKRLSPEREADLIAEVEQVNIALVALDRGREAEACGDYAAAAEEFATAAEADLGDASLRVAICLYRAGEHRSAAQWCARAEAEGFDEAADLAVRCYAELREEPPRRQLTDPPPREKEQPVPEAERATGPRRVASGSADPGLTRRLKALACTAPLHELDTRKAMFDGFEGAHYQMAEIALRTIDQVTIAMDFDRGADHAEIVAKVLPFVADQAPQRDPAEHERIAGWVLERLINVGTVDRTFRQVYGEIDGVGSYRQRTFDFKLVQEAPGPRGTVVLRASDEAITVLIGALDTDVESAQIAAEVKLKNLIERGRLADARLAAEHARYRTVQYGEIIRKRLEATQRDVLLVDWQEELPNLLNDALQHIERRLEEEHAIHASIVVTRDMSEEPEHKRHAAELVAVVEDCIRRHMLLQIRLLSARKVFRDEQDRQRFSGPPRQTSVNLHGQLLAPLLAAPVSDAVGPLSTFFRGSGGVSAPDVFELPHLVSMLLRMTADPSRTAGAVFHPNRDVQPDNRRFTAEHWKVADDMLDLRGEVRRLDELVRAAAEIDADLPVLIALRAGNALAPAIRSARARGERTVLVSVPSGEVINDPDLPVGGDDLFITTAELRPPDPEGRERQSQSPRETVTEQEEEVA